MEKKTVNTSIRLTPSDRKFIVGHFGSIQKWVNGIIDTDSGMIRRRLDLLKAFQKLLDDTSEVGIKKLLHDYGYKGK